MLKKITAFLISEYRYLLCSLVLCVADWFGPGRIGGIIRAALMRCMGLSIGKNTLIRPGIKLSGNFSLLKIGPNTSINFNAILDMMDNILIGRTCQIGPNVSFITSSHVLNSNLLSRRDDQPAGPITINDFVWIGANVTILGGVSIGQGAVVAAGSLVNRDVPAYTVVAGIPAKPIKQLTAPSMPEPVVSTS